MRDLRKWQQKVESGEKIDKDTPHPRFEPDPFYGVQIIKRRNSKDINAYLNPVKVDIDNKRLYMNYRSYGYLLLIMDLLDQPPYERGRVGMLLGRLANKKKMLKLKEIFILRRWPISEEGKEYFKNIDKRDPLKCDMGWDNGIIYFPY